MLSSKVQIHGEKKLQSNSKWKKTHRKNPLENVHGLFQRSEEFSVLPVQNVKRTNWWYSWMKQKFVVLHLKSDLTLRLSANISFFISAVLTWPASRSCDRFSFYLCTRSQNMYEMWKTFSCGLGLLAVLSACGKPAVSPFRKGDAERMLLEPLWDTVFGT